MIDLNEHPLDDLPLLWKWYKKHRSKVLDDNQPSAVAFLLAAVQALVTPGSEKHRLWIQGVHTFLRNSIDPFQDFLELDSLSQDLGKPVSELLSQLCESAIIAGEGQKAFESMRNLANRVPLAVLRFLSAWVAMNVGDLDACIDECEKEAEPQAPIYTLLGQALLESGRAEEAIDALRISLKLDQNDILAVCQLAKAFLVAGNTKEAIKTIEHCRDLVGDHIEIECLAAMIAIADGSPPQEFSNLTLKRLSHYIEQNPGSIDVLILAFDLACVMNSQSGAEQLLKNADFTTWCMQKDFQKRTAQILKKLSEAEWYHVSKIFIDKVLTTTGQQVLTHS